MTNKLIMDNQKQLANKILREINQSQTSVYQLTDWEKERFVNRVHYELEGGRDLLDRSRHINNRIARAYETIFEVLARRDFFPKTTSSASIIKTEVVEEKEKTYNLATMPDSEKTVILEGAPIENYYEVLGVSQDASVQEIKSARRRLAKEINTDLGRSNMSEEQKRALDDRMAQVNVAYTTLSKDHLRSEYNNILQTKSEKGLVIPFNEGVSSNTPSQIGSGTMAQIEEAKNLPDINQNPRFQNYLQKYTDRPDKYNLALKSYKASYPKEYDDYSQRIYASSIDDPWYKAIQENITSRTNKEFKVVQSQADWDRIYSQTSLDAHRSFVMVNPAKAEAYKDSNGAIKTAYESVFAKSERSIPKIDPSSSTGKVRHYAVEFKPRDYTDPNKAEKLKSRAEKKVADLRVGPVSNIFTPEEIAQRVADGTLPADVKPHHIDLANEFVSKGVDPAQVVAIVDRDKRNPASHRMPEELRESLLVSSDIVESYYAANPEYFKQINEARSNPEVTFREVPVYQSSYRDPGLDRVLIELKDNVVSPIVQKPVGIVTDSVKSKAKDKLLKVTGKGASKLGKKVGGKAAERVGAKLAKTGFKQAVQHLGGLIGSAIPVLGTAAGEVIGRILAELAVLTYKFLKKFGKYIAAAGIAMIALGVMSANTALVGAGVVAFGIGAAAGGIAAAGAFASAAGAGIFILTAIIIPAIASTLLLAIILTPVIIAFVVYVITTGAYVVPHQDVRGPICTYESISGIGIFTNGQGSASEWISQTRPSLVLLLDNFSFASSIRSLSPSTIIVGRSHSEFPDNLGDPNVFSRLSNLMSQHPDVGVWQAYNEPLFNGADFTWLTTHDLSVIDAGISQGRDVCIGNFKEGYPRDLNDPGFQNYASQIMSKVNDAGTNITVYLCVHEHEDEHNWSFGQRYNGRFTQIVNAGLNLPVLVTVAGYDSESGPDVGSGVGWRGIIAPETYLTMLQSYYSSARSAGARGVAVFQLGLGGEWESYDIAPLLSLAQECEDPSGGYPFDPNPIQSQYIAMSKFPSPAGPFQNSNLPVTVTYTIEVSATSETLTNISFDYSCSVISRTSGISCPEVVPNIPPPPQSISPGESVLINYSQTYNSPTYIDSLIIDTFTVRADSESSTGEISAARAIIVIGNPPTPGGCSGVGEPITTNLAARITNGSVRLLPENVRRHDTCITPTMLIMHWSAGANDDPNGNTRTYDTLVRRGLSCQLGTDINGTELWQEFYNQHVEIPVCAGEWNTYSINNEIAGVWFTDSPPPPNLQQLEYAYDATCEIMSQYSIPWCQIYGHFDVPNNGGKIDPGPEFLYNLFVPEIRNRCPNDPNSVCSSQSSNSSGLELGPI